jgi:hypothetical protein
MQKLTTLKFHDGSLEKPFPGGSAINGINDWPRSVRFEDEATFAGTMLTSRISKARKSPSAGPAAAQAMAFDTCSLIRKSVDQEATGGCDKRDH